MSAEATRALLWDRWTEAVWHEGQLELSTCAEVLRCSIELEQGPRNRVRLSSTCLAPDCIAPAYVRHYPNGTTRTVTPEEYTQEIAGFRTRYADLRFIWHDAAFEENRAWIRYTWRRTDPDTGQVLTNACMQTYRLQDGKLAETWVVVLDAGTAWPEYQPDEP